MHHRPIQLACGPELHFTLLQLPVPDGTGPRRPHRRVALCHCLVESSSIRDVFLDWALSVKGRVAPLPEPPRLCPSVISMVFPLTLGCRITFVSQHRMLNVGGDREKERGERDGVMGDDWNVPDNLERPGGLPGARQCQTSSGWGRLPSVDNGFALVTERRVIASD